MLSNKKLFLNKFIIAKDEFVSMKLHFRYHTYLYIKEGNIDEGCKYCQDRLVSGNDKNGERTSNEDENKKSVWVL
jgi:biotin synthase-like enzyme